jgi:hypothetical protein
LFRHLGTKDEFGMVSLDDRDHPLSHLGWGNREVLIAEPATEPPFGAPDTEKTLAIRHDRHPEIIVQHVVVSRILPRASLDGAVHTR